MPCSFCSSTEHRVHFCTSADLVALYFEMIQKYREVVSQEENGDARLIFTSVFDVRYTVRQLRSVSMRYSIGNSTYNKGQCIDDLWRHISDRIANPARYQYSHPAIPEVEEQNQEVEEQDIVTWAIDTTPTPIPELLGIQAIRDLHQSQEDLQEMIARMEQQNESTPVRTFYVGGLPLAQRRRIQQISGRIIEGPSGRIINLEGPSGRIIRNDAIPSGRIIETRMHFNIVPRKYRIDSTLKEEQPTTNTEMCSICFEDVCVNDMVKLNCPHEFCGSCMKQCFETHTKTGNPCCAMCRSPIQSFHFKNRQTYDLLVGSLVM